MKLIDKDEIVREIEKRIEAHKENLKDCDSSITEMILKGSMSAYQSFLHFLDTLEVKEANLDELLSNLDKDIKEFVTTEEFEKDSATYGHYWAIAKYAFLLGLKARGK